LWGLLQQTLLSAFFVRPMQIYVFSGLLPGLVLQLGLTFKHRKERRLKAAKSNRKTHQKKQEVELVELNRMLANPMLSAEKTDLPATTAKKRRVLDINGKERHGSWHGEHPSRDTKEMKEAEKLSTTRGDEGGIEVVEHKTLTISLPKGIKPGNKIHVNLPDSRQIDITVPKGMRSGNTLTINYNEHSHHVKKKVYWDINGNERHGSWHP
jgi:hypothetical protein